MFVTSTRFLNNGTKHANARRNHQVKCRHETQFASESIVASEQSLSTELPVQITNVVLMILEQVPD